MTTKEALERLKQPFNATPDTDSYFDAKEVAMKSLEKDLSIVKELEKIKAEIEEHNRKYLSEDNAGLERAIYDFIEPHITELKGEQK